ncbi:hypothetical protein LBMAG16_11060 [Actinomycetes bacterium]|nr:hypothetical protein LBMAG16_11060 [Actinomycetes bacterium]
MSVPLLARPIGLRAVATITASAITSPYFKFDLFGGTFIYLLPMRNPSRFTASNRSLGGIGEARVLESWDAVV